MKANSESYQNILRNSSIMHPIISEVIRYNYPPDYNYSKPLIVAMTKFDYHPITWSDYRDILKHYISVVDVFENVNEHIYKEMLLKNYSILSKPASNSNEIGIEYYDKLIDMINSKEYEINIENGWSEFYKAQFLFKSKDYFAAIKAYEHALSSFDKQTKSNKIIKSIIYQHIGFCFISLLSAHTINMMIEQKNDNINKNIQLFLCHKAVDSLITAHDFYKELFGQYHFTVLFCATEIAFPFILISDFDKAKDFLKIAENIAKRMHCNYGLGWVTFRKSAIPMMQGDFSGAHHLIEKAIEICAVLEDAPEVIFTKHLITVVEKIIKNPSIIKDPSIIKELSIIKDPYKEIGINKDYTN